MSDSKDVERDSEGRGSEGPPEGDATEVVTEGATDSAEPTDPAEVEALRRQLESAQERYLRLAAEFDNYRRRSLAQMGESEVRAQARLVGTLLDALDDLERVISLDPELATVESVLEGVALVELKLSNLLGDAGLEEVDPEGEPFDPNVMEAMRRVPASSSDEDDLVDEVFQRGFRFRGHLVRPARVSVRKFD